MGLAHSSFNFAFYPLHLALPSLFEWQGRRPSTPFLGTKWPATRTILQRMPVQLHCGALRLFLAVPLGSVSFLTLAGGFSWSLLSPIPCSKSTCTTEDRARMGKEGVEVTFCDFVLCGFPMFHVHGEPTRCYAVMRVVVHLVLVIDFVLKGSL